MSQPGSRREGSVLCTNLGPDGWDRVQGSPHHRLLPQAPVLHVALLKQAPGADFSRVAPSPSPGQVFMLGKCFCTPSSPAQFRVAVRVQSSCFGAVQQWVVFHFSHWAVLLRKLELQLGEVHSWGLWGTPGLPEGLAHWQRPRGAWCGEDGQAGSPDGHVQGACSGPGALSWRP